MREDLIAHDTSGDYRILRMLTPQALKGIVGWLIDDGVLFDPSDLAIRRLHLQKSPVTIQHLELLPVADGSGFTRHRCDTITQPGLFGNDINQIFSAGCGAVTAGDARP